MSNVLSLQFFFLVHATVRCYLLII